ncbi:MAG: YbhB/YbcL family Raf kinase inhibitor-like protein [Candidatus Thiodiazotropha sp.]
MKKSVFLFCCCALTSQLTLASDFIITSPQVTEGQRIGNEQVFNGFGCAGGNVSPEFHWRGAPKETKSFALTVYDPDAPTGSGWWHWVLFNIPSSATTLLKGAASHPDSLPTGTVQSRTDFGKPGYGGPCPPSGDKPHRYEITLYALKTDKLPLAQDASPAMVGFYLYQNLIKKTVLTAHYSR